MMSLNGSLKAQSDSICFDAATARLIAEQLANFKEVSNDYASLQRSYHLLQTELEVIKLRESTAKDECKMLHNRLKTSATTRRTWRKLRKEIIIEL